jgi:hypothetical protein
MKALIRKVLISSLIAVPVLASAKAEITGPMDDSPALAYVQAHQAGSQQAAAAPGAAQTSAANAASPAANGGAASNSSMQ